jgi:hypothetical protein
MAQLFEHIMQGINNSQLRKSIEDLFEIFGIGKGDQAGAVSIVADVTGDLVGNVTGNLDGDVTGNVTGDVSGAIAGGWTYGPEIDCTNGDADDTVSFVVLADLPATVRTIELIFNGVGTDENLKVPMVRIGDSGGIETSGYGASAHTIEAAAITAEFGSWAGFYCADLGSWATAQTMTGILRMVRRNDSSNMWYVDGYFMENVGDAKAMQCVGSKSLSTGLTQVDIATSDVAAFFDKGTVRGRYM